MPAHPIFSDAHREYIRRLYLTQSLQPATITPMVNKKFGTSYTPIQVQRLVNVKWSKLRKERNARAIALQGATDAQLATNGARKLMDRFADKAARLTDKNLDLALTSTDARSAASATAAAKAALTMTRLCLGIEGADPAAAASYNFNFIAIEAPKVGEGEPSSDAVDVSADEIHDEDEDCDGADAESDEAEAAAE